MECGRNIMRKDEMMGANNANADADADADADVAADVDIGKSGVWNWTDDGLDFSEINTLTPHITTALCRSKSHRAQTPQTFSFFPGGRCPPAESKGRRETETVVPQSCCFERPVRMMHCDHQLRLPPFSWWWPSIISLSISLS